MVKIKISNHAKMRAKERVKYVSNGEEAIEFIIKEFNNLIDRYVYGEKGVKIYSKGDRKIIYDGNHKFVYVKNKKLYKIITYYDMNEIRKVETGKFMKDFKRYMREANGIFNYNKNTNHY